MKIDITVSCGELLDKLSILEIKSKKIKDKDKLKNIAHEKLILSSKAEALRNADPNKYQSFFDELLEINQKLWKIEDEIRIFEKDKIFNEKFIELARQVYVTNDLRFDLKNKINIFYKSGIVEEKEYINYKTL